MVCPGYFVDYANWAGADLGAVLALAGVQADAVAMRLRAADGYGADVSLATALSQEAFLAYEWEGQAVPVLHGFPVRAVFPREEGNRWVKWLVEIEVN